jgi:hypothetical protein
MHARVAPPPTHSPAVAGRLEHGRQRALRGGQAAAGLRRHVARDPRPGPVPARQERRAARGAYARARVEIQQPQRRPVGAKRRESARGFKN